MDFFKKLGRKVKTGAAAAVAMVAAPAAMAQTDYSPITDAVDWAAVGTAAILIFAGIGAVFVVFRGGRLILSAIKR